MIFFKVRLAFWTATIVAISAATFASSCLAQGATAAGSPAAQERVAHDIKPAIAAMTGDESIVKDSLLRSIVATSLTYKNDKTIILYSPIHAVVIFMHIDAKGKLFTYAFGFGELYEIGGYKYNRAASYSMMRYEYVPILINNMLANMKKDPSYVANVIYPASQKRRDYEENKRDLLIPIARMIQPENIECIHTLDRARLIEILKSNLPNQKYLEWFDNMFAADILPDIKGNRTIIFVNDLTRRLHLFVPVALEGGKCVPGIPWVTFIK